MSKGHKVDIIKKHYQAIKGKHIKDLFAKDKSRAHDFSIKCDNIFFDYSKNLISREALKDLLKLLTALNLDEEIKAMLTGEAINKTEQRAVLHTALRDPSKEPIYVSNENIKIKISDVYKKASLFAEKVHHQLILGATGKVINHIINIGIGGSDLGPKMAVYALRDFANPRLKVDFISNVDPAELARVLAKTDPERVLFIIASKTFSTEETIANATNAKNWLKEKLTKSSNIENHFIALSTNIKAAKEFGVAEELIFPFWDWVGGRFSLASVIGISLMISIGPKEFDKLLAGMNYIDNHFINEPYDKNIPVILAILSYWYNNFWGHQTSAILPYSADLALFPSYLQQLEMESNGKMVDREGKKIDYQSAPIIWGAAGTDAQHSFFQLLHQGTKIVPSDFIGFRKTNAPFAENHHILMANFFAQQQALAFGMDDFNSLTEKKSEDFIKAHRVFPGNRPSNCLLLDELTPFSLGQLVAIYEHKVFVQGVLWNVFSFDQWGVELGKFLAKKVKKTFKNKSLLTNFDASSRQLIEHYLNSSDKKVAIKEQKKVEIWTDGSCLVNPGPGGWAAILIFDENNQQEISGGQQNTTNNRMELTAVISSLKAVPSGYKAVVYSDSNYIVKGATLWLANWKRRNWRKANGELLNQDLWQELDFLIGKMDINWRWVRAHSGVKYNERCDILAKEQAQQARINDKY
ncbi:MAG: glucose-6-phosphate isomerase [SAR324 cluster bacterium]|nr:glucose-6-phosphate isomerase [SAR324 cluster bacterium]